jgi:hypothetical protein
LEAQSLPLSRSDYDADFRILSPHGYCCCNTWFLSLQGLKRDYFCTTPEII